eukprot:scaffold39077_cov189-Skeletonema_marinoi.AAC.7
MMHYETKLPPARRCCRLLASCRYASPWHWCMPSIRAIAINHRLTTLGIIILMNARGNKRKKMGFLFTRSRSLTLHFGSPHSATYRSILKSTQNTKIQDIDHGP